MGQEDSLVELLVGRRYYAFHAVIRSLVVAISSRIFMHMSIPLSCTVVVLSLVMRLLVQKLIVIVLISDSLVGLFI